MGQWVHRLSEVNLEAGTAVCAQDGLVPVYRSRSGREGVRCGVKHKQIKQQRGTANAKMRTKRKKYKKSYCEHCWWEPDDPCQLDLDHIDGNPRNNKIENWQTLCANCHRLKTWRPDLFLAQKHE